MYRFLLSSLATEPSLVLPYTPVPLTYAHGIHMITRTSIPTEATFCVGPLYIMGMLKDNNYYIELLVVFLCSDDFDFNNNSGHSEQNSSNKLLGVQTPASDFSVNTKSVSCKASV